MHIYYHDYSGLFLEIMYKTYCYSLSHLTSIYTNCVGSFIKKESS